MSYSRLMENMAAQFEADGRPEAAALFRNPNCMTTARAFLRSDMRSELELACSKVYEVCDIKKAFAKEVCALTRTKNPFRKEEVANAMLCDLYEQVKIWKGPGAGVAALIARSKFGTFSETYEWYKLLGEMPRLMDMDEKRVEEELRKLGVPLNFVEPAALGAKPKSPAREPVEESEFEKWVKTRPWYPLFCEVWPWYPDEPSPAKKAKSEK